MANQTIDTLDAAAALASGDKFPLAASGSDTLKRATVSQLQTYMQANLSFGGGAEVLSANRTYYVRTDGDDANNGLANTAGGAFLTIQKAVNVAATLVTNGYTVTVQIADGSYFEFVSVRWPSSNTVLQIVGNSGTPANVAIDGISCFSGYVDVTGVDVVDNATCYGGLIRFFSSRGARFRTDTGGGMTVGDLCAVYVSADYAFKAQGNSVLLLTDGITVTGTPAYAVGFAVASEGSVLQSYATFTGSATGPRYYSELNGVINTYGAGATYFPGDVAGSTATGGQYA